MLEKLAAPTVYPVSLATVKDWSRETSTASDAVLARLIRSAVEIVEGTTHLALVYRTVRERLNYAFPPYFTLFGCPLLGVRAITYVDPGGATQTLDPTIYSLDRTSIVPRLEPAYANNWPATRPVLSAVSITYDIGLLVPVTAIAADGTITAAGHNKVNGDIVQLSTDGLADLGEALPTPFGANLTALTAYYVVNANGDNLQLSLTPGGAAIAAAGNSLTKAARVFIGVLPADMVLAMQLMVESWHRNRSEVSPQQVFEMPAHGAAHRLLIPYMARGFQ